ncbi:MAG: DUF4258 domain-containing protein [Elusimicrobia bacterium]|nr:DUF4258 domain-containing protein [Elusimicrobiota bacterium]
MAIHLHPHAVDRLIERGATKSEVIETVNAGETFPAKYGRVGFRRNFQFGKPWKDKIYATKQIEAYAVKEENNWLVITFITRFF